MGLRFKSFPHTYNEHQNIIEIISLYNTLDKSHSAVAALKEKFDEANLGYNDGDEIQIPVLLPYCKPHEDGTFVLETEKKIVDEAPVTKEYAKKDKGTDKYKPFPYTFGRPNETVRAVIRLYNDMSLEPKMIDWLMEEFNEINKDSLPVRLCSTHQIPVLLPFTNRHEKDRKIFKNGK